MLLCSAGGSRKMNIDGMHSFIDKENPSAAVASQVCGGVHVR
jgi:hypothetical protein